MIYTYIYIYIYREREREGGEESRCRRIFIKYVRFEDFTAVNMKNKVFWHVTPCGWPHAPPKRPF
jgi:hypothetical protein